MALDRHYHAPWSGWYSLETGFYPRRIWCDLLGHFFEHCVICVPKDNFLWPWIGSIILTGLVSVPWGQAMVPGGSGVIGLDDILAFL